MRGLKIERVKEREGVCGVGVWVVYIKQRPTKQGIVKAGFSFLVIKLGKYNYIGK